MAIDNLPLFNAVNDEEVGHPAHPGHGHPSHPFDCAPHGRPFTRQEAHYEIMHRVEACIAEVHRFEERVRFEVDKFMRSSGTENQAFKEALQAAHNCFLETVQNEVNNFEQSMSNNYDLLRGDLDQRVADFTTSINNAFETLNNELTQSIDNTLGNMTTAYDILMEDLRQMRMNLNGDYTAFVNQVHNAMQLYQNTVNDKLAEQDEQILASHRYLVDSLPHNARVVISQMVANGELDPLMEEWFGTDHLFRGSYTYAEGTALEELEVGDYFFCTDNEHYYMYGQTAHTYIAEEPDGPPPDGFYMWFDIGTTFREVNLLKTEVDDLQNFADKPEFKLEYNNIGYFNQNGLLNDAESSAAFRYTDAIPVPMGAEKLYVKAFEVNPYTTRIVFSRGGDVKNANHLVSKYNNTDAEWHEVDVPDGATCFYVTLNSTEVDGRNPRPIVRISDLLKSYTNGSGKTASELSSIKTNMLLSECNFENIPLTFVQGYYIGVTGNIAASAPYAISAPITVKAGEIYAYNATGFNEYTKHIAFSNMSYEVNHAAIATHKFTVPGYHLVVVPEGVSYMYVSDCRDQSAKLPTVMPTLMKLKDSIHDAIVNTLSSKTSVGVHLPSKITLVAGETFELFYRGVVDALSMQGLYVRAECSIGKAYKRKFVATPDTAGSYTLTITVYDAYGVVKGDGTTTLEVVNKSANKENKKVFVIGDSLTAANVWPVHAANKLITDGNNVTFVGKKGTTHHYEATGGYSLTTYLGLTNDNPFFDASTNSVNIGKYLSECGGENPDVCCILLGWNSMYDTDVNYKQLQRDFIGRIRAAAPAATILLMGVQVPSVDGFGENYGASFNMAERLKYPFRHAARLKEVASEYENVFYIDVASQFDSEYNMPAAERPANLYSSETERVGNNGVHPSEAGYKQIGDVAYRAITALLNQ